MIILIAGYPGSGKTTLASMMGAFKDLSSVIQGPDKLKEGERIRKEFPKGILARMVYDPQVAVYSGIRSPEEVEVMKTYDEILLVFMVASPETRRKRLGYTGPQLEERDNRERALGLDEVRARSDLFVVNEGTLDELREVAQWILKQLPKSQSQKS